MNKRKLIILLIAIVSSAGLVKAQTGNFINVSGQMGFVTNSKQDRKFGVGGSAAFLLQDNFLAVNQDNYLTFTLKAFNNPFLDGKLIKSVLNNAYDAFNYIGILAGYRFTAGGAEDGFYVEPRLGVGALAGGANFLFSPVVGYGYRNFDFGIFGDMGFRGKPMATNTNNAFTVGLTVGYNIAL